MLRMKASTSVADAKSYYVEGFSREDYYTQNQEIIGVWGGQGAALLGLSGPVDREAFMALCDNLHPVTGEKLTPRTKAQRTVGYDLNFHVPKSVSVVQALSRDQRIIAVFREAVYETMQELEVETKTRVRREGVKDDNRPTGNLIWAEFVHLTARPVGGIPDPHLHAHCYAFNATFDGVEERWKAGQFRDINQDAPFYEAVFQNRLAHKLQELGYAIERKGKAFEIQGVPESVLAKFSRRTQQIEQVAQKLGITDDKAKDKLGALTREAKVKDLSLEDLRTIWLAQLTPEEQQTIAKLHVVTPQPETPHPSPTFVPTEAMTAGSADPPIPTEELAIQYALLHSFEKASVITERKFLETVLRFGVGRVEVERVKASLVGRPDLLRRDFAGKQMLTTPEVLAEEQALVAWAKAGKGAVAALAPEYSVPDSHLSDEQQKAIRHILTSQDRVTGVQGKSGAGKTTLMKEAIAAMEARQHAVLILTPRAQTARETLPQEGFKNTQTVAQLLTNETLPQAFQNGVWWIDEAGQLSTRDMYKLVNLAEQHCARLVLSGDTRQHGPVERGDALRMLQEHAGLELMQMGKIQRQTGVYREAVEHLSEGRMAEGVAKLDTLGAIREIEDEQRHVQLAQDYLESLQAGASALVISPTHAECRKVTDCIRSQLKEAGQIKNEQTVAILRSLDLSEAQRRDARTYRPGVVIEMVKSAKGYAPGERLEVVELSRDPQEGLRVKRSDGQESLLPVHQCGDRFQVYEKDEIAVAVGEALRITKNGWSADRRYKQHNGSLKKVVGFTPEGHLQLEGNVVLPREFAHLAYGYATTSHAAQGKTVDRVFIAESAESFGAASQEQFYVSVSRGRKLCRIYTNDREALLEAVQATSQRLAALDVVQEETPLPLDQTEEHTPTQQGDENVPTAVELSIEQTLSQQEQAGPVLETAVSEPPPQVIETETPQLEPEKISWRLEQPGPVMEMASEEQKQQTEGVTMCYAETVEPEKVSWQLGQNQEVPMPAVRSHVELVRAEPKQKMEILP